MKKIILSFLVLFFCLFPFDVFGKEIVISDLYSNYYTGDDHFKAADSFNYLTFISDDFFKEKLEYYNEVISENNKATENHINIYSNINLYSRDGERIGTKLLKLTYRIYNNKIVNMLLYIDNVNVIKANLYNYIIFFDHDINYYDFKEEDPNVALACSGDLFYESDYPITNIFSIMPDLLFSFYYDYVEETNISIPTFSNLTEEEIVNEVGLVDNFGNRLLLCEIIESDYISYTSINNYHIKIRGLNKERQAIFKIINIDVISTKNILQSAHFTTSCDEIIDDLDIINDLDIQREYENIKISSEYHYAYNKKGNYKYIANIKFSDMNLIISGDIVVSDNESPYGIITPELITVPNDYCMTKEEILKKFSIYDNQDGYISSTNITLDGFINYLSSYKALNDHYIVLKAKDSSGNTYTHNFIIRVTDDKSYSELKRFSILEYVENKQNIENDVIESAKENKYNPIISNSNYVIKAYVSHKLTVSEIQDLLISEGYLKNSENVSIESEYFKEEKPKAGTFSLSVKYENGDVTYYEINLVEKEEIIEEEKSYTGLIVSIIIGGIAIIATIILLIMRFYVHAKKN
ncbi:MAG: hypothetical protein K5892_05240 [Acholeplasmatales bacterium]|nr:hypothetical protein [Acholeplasmatales bacterium]